MGLLLGVMLSGDNHFIGEKHMSNQDDKYTLIEEIEHTIMEHNFYEEGISSLAPKLSVLAESHLKQKIRTDTLDEVKEAYEYEANMQGLPQEVFNAIGKAIDNLRGRDE